MKEDYLKYVLKSTHLISDVELSDKKLSVRIRKLLFENRKVNDGRKVAVRLNINGSYVAKFPIQTIHSIQSKSNPLGKVLGYDYIVSLDDVTFYINQKAREKIASGDKSKYPMASSVGSINNNRPHDIIGSIVFFNPKKHHLFVDENGYAVKSCKQCTNYGMTVFCSGIEYWKKSEAPKPFGNSPSYVKYLLD